jgi:hypothetical protein
MMSFLRSYLWPDAPTQVKQYQVSSNNPANLKVEKAKLFKEE